jgi:transposase
VDLRREMDIEQLRRVALAQQVQIEQLLRVLSSQAAELGALKGNDTELQEKLALVEQLTRQSQQVTEQLKALDGAGKKKSKKPREKFGNTEQPKLPMVEQVFTLDEADKTCPSCGGELLPMKDQFETSEMIDVIEISYRVVSVKQQKYTCRCGGCVETAVGPERAVPGSRYSLDFAVKVAIDKYLDHIPLSRQERILKRHGATITSQTLWDLLNALGRRLASVSSALLARVLAEPVVGLDQTSWPRLDGKADKPWQMWCLTGPRAVVHRIRNDKGADTFRALMGDYHGVVVCDALKTHEAGARGNDRILLAGCWAHVFRKFEEAAPDHPEANLAMKWIGELYEIDELAAGDVGKKAELRQTKSAEVITRMKTWLWNQATLKSLSIGNAAAYVIANWDRLTRFLGDVRIPLDNNATERAIRGPVVGRRNHFGSKSQRGTEVAAVFYTLLETAKLCGVDPARYLREAALADARGEVMLPHELADVASG